jgi:hypothetical protein
MPSLFSARWLALLGMAALIIVTASGVQAAPAQQNVVSIVVFAYVDVAGNPGPGYPAPACNLEFDTADGTYALTDELPAMEFVLRDGSGTELSRQTTTLLATLQRARFDDVAEEESYILQLTSPPAGWTLCPQETADRTLTQADFSLNRARVTYHFFKASMVTPPAGETATATQAAPTTAVPTATVTPGGPTVTPLPTGVRPTSTPRPTLVPRPTSEEQEEAAPASEAALQPVGCTGLSSIKGLAFIDQNADGKLGPTEPGLNDVEIHLHGGGLEISAITPSSGQYSFEALGAGTYDVFISPGPEWKITTPSLYHVTVACNVVMGYDFGLIRYSEMPAASVAPAAAAPSTGIKLPATGVMEVPGAPLFGGLAAALAVLGLVGLTLERWRAGRP